MVKAEPTLFEEPDLEADERATLAGEADADAGRVVAHEDVAVWLDTWGKPGAGPPPAKWFK